MPETKAIEVKQASLPKWNAFRQDCVVAVAAACEAFPCATELRPETYIGPAPFDAGDSWKLAPTLEAVVQLKTKHFEEALLWLELQATELLLQETLVALRSSGGSVELASTDWVEDWRSFVERETGGTRESRVRYILETFEKGQPARRYRLRLVDLLAKLSAACEIESDTAPTSLFQFTRLALNRWADAERAVQKATTDFAIGLGFPVDEQVTEQISSALLGLTLRKRVLEEHPVTHEKVDPLTETGMVYPDHPEVELFLERMCGPLLFTGVNSNGEALRSALAIQRRQLAWQARRSDFLSACDYLVKADFLVEVSVGDSVQYKLSPKMVAPLLTSTCGAENTPALQLLTSARKLCIKAASSAVTDAATAASKKAISEAASFLFALAPVAKSAAVIYT
jgi:hypothetical protein